MPPRPALPPESFENMGAGLESKKKCGKPFRRDPAAKPDMEGAHPKGLSDK